MLFLSKNQSSFLDNQRQLLKKKNSFENMRKSVGRAHAHYGQPDLGHPLCSVSEFSTVPSSISDVL